MTEAELKKVLDKVLDKKLDAFGGKLFTYLDKHSEEVRTQIEEQNEKYDSLISTLDAFLKRLDISETDDIARDHKVARLERWIEQVAAETGVKLKY